MAAVESALVPLETDDTVDSVLAKVRATHSRVVQLLVPPDTAALQAPRGFERLRRALDAEGVSLLVFSVDEQVLAAARRSAIEVIAIDDGRTKRPPLPPRGPRGERTTQVLAETRLDPRDAAFIDALDQVPAHERYGDDPDADLYAALDDLSDVNQQLDREARRESAGRDLPPARVSHSAGAAERPSGARRYSADDIDLDDEEIDRPRARRSPTGRIAAADRLPQTQARRFSPALLLLLALVLVGLAGAAWVFANRTSITVAAPTSASADTPFAGVVIPLNPAGGGSGASVQAAPVSADVEASVAGAVQNETLSPSGTAKGEVTIVNTVESAVPLPKGSEFIGKNDSGEDVRFTLDSDVTVPGAQTTSSLAGRSTTFGQINVAVTARSPGSASNVGENAIKQILIPGQQPIVSDSSNFLIRHGPIGGGSEAPQRIVTEADVRGVLAEALTQLYNTGVQELRAKIDEGQFGIDATTITPSVADLSNPDSYEPLVVEPGIGQPVADPSNPAFRVTVRARFYALAAPRGKPVTDQLGPVVRDYFAQQTNSACKPGEVPSQTVERVRWDGERLTIDGVQHCSAAEQLAPETLAKVRTALRGQPREAAEASLRTLQQQGLIGDFQLPDRASFPRFDFLLDINVAR